MKIENKIIKTELFKWRDLIPLQPKNFKELSKANYEKLKTSIINNNFVMSFTVWDSGAGMYKGIRKSSGSNVSSSISDNHSERGGAIPTLPLNSTPLDNSEKMN
jgi:hypothetical protein